jgi:anti-sigma B factor antagonist
MQWQSRWDEDVFIIELSGKLMGGAEVDSFHDLVRDAVKKGCQTVVVDMSGVEWLNSWGVGLLVSAYTTMRNVNGVLALAGCSQKVMSVLRMTRFDSVFAFSSDAKAAVETYKSA